ncbi:MAG TPA: hypothetical protein VM118_09260 [Acidobacteriota bacterium]|nr:hypothetical protein [Acidobacteriota bacterium]
MSTFSFRLILALCLGLLLLAATGLANEIGPRRMVLPSESLAKEAYLTVARGNWVAALSYEYEILEDAVYYNEETRNTEHSFTLNTSLALDITYGLSENITFNAIIPYRYIYNTSRVDSALVAGTPGVFFDSRRGSQGLGDVILMTYLKLNVGQTLYFGDHYTPEGNDGYDDYIKESPGMYAGRRQGAVLAAAFGVRLPTGATDAVDADGNRLPDDLQLGTGTMDPIVGLLYHHRYYRLGWGLSALYRLSSQENIYHYEWGGEFVGAAYLAFRLNKNLEWVAQFNGVALGRDKLNGLPFTNRGGKVAYFTPSLIYVGSKMVTLQASAEIPIYRNLNESQLSSDYIINLRTSFLFD